MSKNNLGRGLDSLFSSFEEDDEPIQSAPVASPTGEPINLPIGQIDNNPNQPRKRFDETALNELASSIKNIGLIQPIVVVKRNGRYMIVSGERRWRASKLAGLTTIPSIIKEYTDKEVAQIALIENLQREDLNPIESARAIKELIEKFDMTQEAVAEKIGKSRPAIANTIRLLSLSSPVVKLIEENRLSAGHGKVLVGIEDPKLQLELAELASDNKVTVRELEKYIKQCKNGTLKKAPEPQSVELKAFAKRLQDAFSTKVTIMGNDNKGRIFINYYSKDDLDRIYNALNK